MLGHKGRYWQTQPADGCPCGMLKRSLKNAVPPVVLVHGGAGTAEKRLPIKEEKNRVIGAITRRVWSNVHDGQTALEAATDIVGQLETCGQFNAGAGAVLQSDGMARLSASIMDSRNQKFSGVQLATHMIHPSALAYALQNKAETVIGPLGAQLLARELGIAPQNPVCKDQVKRWLSTLEDIDGAVERHGTVGAVVLDHEGNLAAATSTGGNRTNTPERISDSATVAGNYASPWAAVSCTGIGEQIVDDGVAVRLETRVRDGRSIVEASERMFEEGVGQSREYGWIGIDRYGSWVVFTTTEAITAVVMSQGLDAERIG